MKIVCIIILLIIGLFMAGAALYTRFDLFKVFYHNVLGWHKSDNSPKSFDGCSLHSKCRICGKDIMQDSQGNWF